MPPSKFLLLLSTAQPVRIHWAGGGLCLATGTWSVGQGTGISGNGQRLSDKQLLFCRSKMVMFWREQFLGHETLSPKVPYSSACPTPANSQEVSGLTLSPALWLAQTLFCQFQWQLIRERGESSHPNLIYQLNWPVIWANLSWRLFSNIIELY